MAPTVITDAEGLKKGDKVEVSSEEEGMRGSWYTATVIRPVTKKTKKIYVEYDTLMSEEDESKPLRESVDAILVRPLPPREESRGFKLMEEVDAFYSDGWWEGVVTQVLENSRYSVFFRTSREQIDFDETDLRVHREWVRGYWQPPLEESQS